MKNSKPLFYFFVIVLLFFSNANYSLAQSLKNKDAISFNVVGLDYYGLFKNDFAGGEYVTNGLKIGYHRNLGSDRLNLEIPLFFGGSKVPIEPLPNDPLGDISVKTLKISFGGLLQVQAFKENRFVVPYLSGGFVITNISDVGGLHAEFPLGIGFDFKLFKRSYFHIRPEYRFGVLEENRDNVNLNIGLKFLLNSAKEKTPSIEEDRDQDGVLNEVDKCPDIPGLVYLRGCPDSDSDGIIDEDDLCPTILGLAKFGGCPDSDNDGIPDPNDKCPNEAGPIPNGGCPNVDLDSDGDGVMDKVDECIYAPGLPKFNGCPDTDGDGISDNEDGCPNKKGPAIFGGCPDSDKDGIIDKNDNCPNEAGPKSNKGCPEVVKEVQEAVNLAAKNVQFENNSSQIKTKSYVELDNVFNLLQQYPEYNVSIGGHTDSAGNEDYNQKLSERRATACLDYLAEKGISRSRMSSAGYGETQPISGNSTNSEREMNRRVEFVLFKK
ncbi:MAG: OmpA family protein [Saprospiraceae bacterium]